MKYLLALVILVSGCSFGMAKPARNGSRPVACSKAAPAADTVGAIGFLGMSALVAAYLRSETEIDGVVLGPASWGETAKYAGPLAVIGVVYAVAAVYGHRRVDECRALNEQRPHLAGR